MLTCVAGGGNGGLALAARWVALSFDFLSVKTRNYIRLSEDSNIQVGVIEAGGLNLSEPVINIPGEHI